MADYLYDMSVSAGMRRLLAGLLGGLLATGLLPIGPASAHTLNPLANDSPYMYAVAGQTPPQVWVQNPNFSSTFDTLTQMGISWSFMWVAWSDIEVVPGQYDFSNVDQIVKSAHDHGIQIVMQVQAEGGWTKPGPAQELANGGFRINSLMPPGSVGNPFPSTAAPKNLSAPIAYWKAIVNRYHSGGVLAHSLGWQDGYGILNYEVENEPDIWPFFTAGNWQTVAKDYAAYVTGIATAVHSIDHTARIVAPTLGTGPDSSGPPLSTMGGGDGSQFLDHILNAANTPANLAWASDDYRAAVAAGQQVVIGAGPAINVYSFHWDGENLFGTAPSLFDPSTFYGPQRKVQLQTVVNKYANQPGYPTHPHADFWATEGGPAPLYPPATGGSNDLVLAWQSIQYALELLGAGVSRFNWPTAIVNSPTDPYFQATHNLTTYFPSGHGVADISSAISATAGQQVYAYKWVNPHSGRSSIGLWALDEPINSGITGPDFTVTVPVTSPHALIISSDFSQTLVTASNGGVQVRIHRGDPSPPVMVIEQP
jgi:hypothetical protein